MQKSTSQSCRKGKLEKRESNTYLVLGITQTRLGKFEKAIKTFRKAVTLMTLLKMRLNGFDLLKDSLLKST